MFAMLICLFCSTAVITPTPTLSATEVLTTPTELHLRLVNAEGEPVPFSRAELLVAAYQVTTTTVSFPIETNGDLLVLPLDEKVVQDTIMTHNLDNIWGYFLYLEADGYAPVRSQNLVFVGMSRGWRMSSTEDTLVPFHHGPRVTGREGETTALTLTLRTLQTRTLIFVDDNNDPVPDVNVKSFVYWHRGMCDYPLGFYPLSEGISDANGRVPIPDGEFEYMLQFDHESYHLQNSSHPNPMLMIDYLLRQEVVIPLRALQKQPLTIIVRENGELQANKMLTGCSNYCTNDCGYDIIASNEEGVIFIEDFYPDQWGDLYLRGSKGGARWLGFTHWDEIIAGETIEVELTDPYPKWAPR